RSSCTSFFTGEAVNGGMPPIGSRLKPSAVRCCLAHRARGGCRRSGNTRLLDAAGHDTLGSAQARSARLIFITTSLFPLRDEDEVVGAPCSGTLRATDFLQVVLNFVDTGREGRSVKEGTGDARCHSVALGWHFSPFSFSFRHRVTPPSS
ncbi:hypothetical protein B0H14DRAFT_3046103, partial [Mycena olivaceomarginata]